MKTPEDDKLDALLRGYGHDPIHVTGDDPLTVHRAMAAAGADALTEPFKAAGLHTAMQVIPLLCFLLALVLWAASRAIGPDVDKLNAWRELDPSPANAPQPRL